MSKPIKPKTTRSEELRQAALKKKKEDAEKQAEQANIGLVPTRPKVKTTKSFNNNNNETTNLFQNSDPSNLFDTIEDSTAHKTFASEPSYDNKFNSFIQAFDEDDGIIEDLQPLRRISRDYRSDSSIVFTGESVTGNESIIASVPSRLETITQSPLGKEKIDLNNLQNEDISSNDISDSPVIISNIQDTEQSFQSENIENVENVENIEISENTENETYIDQSNESNINNVNNSMMEEVNIQDEQENQIEIGIEGHEEQVQEEQVQEEQVQEEQVQEQEQREEVDDESNETISLGEIAFQQYKHPITESGDSNNNLERNIENIPFPIPHYLSTEGYYHSENNTNDDGEVEVEQEQEELNIQNEREDNEDQNQNQEQQIEDQEIIREEENFDDDDDIALNDLITEETNDDIDGLKHKLNDLNIQDESEYNNFEITPPIIQQQEQTEQQQQQENQQENQQEQQQENQQQEQSNLEFTYSSYENIESSQIIHNENLEENKQIQLHFETESSIFDKIQSSNSPDFEQIYSSEIPQNENITNDNIEQENNVNSDEIVVIETNTHINNEVLEQSKLDEIEPTNQVSETVTIQSNAKDVSNLFNSDIQQPFQSSPSKIQSNNNNNNNDNMELFGSPTPPIRASSLNDASSLFSEPSNDLFSSSVPIPSSNRSISASTSSNSLNQLKTKTTRITNVSDASSLFGGGSEANDLFTTSTSTKPPINTTTKPIINSQSTTAYVAPMNDASTLFGGTPTQSNDLFNTTKVIKQPGKIIPKSQLNNPFESNQSSSTDINQPKIESKVINPRNNLKIQNSNLFSSTQSADNLFNSTPPSSVNANDLFSSPPSTIQSADNLFNVPPPLPSSSSSSSLQSNIINNAPPPFIQKSTTPNTISSSSADSLFNSPPPPPATPNIPFSNPTISSADSLFNAPSIPVIKKPITPNNISLQSADNLFNEPPPPPVTSSSSSLLSSSIITKEVDSVSNDMFNFPPPTISSTTNKKKTQSAENLFNSSSSSVTANDIFGVPQSTVSPFDNVINSTPPTPPSITITNNIPPPVVHSKKITPPTILSADNIFNAPPPSTIVANDVFGAPPPSPHSLNVTTNIISPTSTSSNNNNNIFNSVPPSQTSLPLPLQTQSQSQTTIVTNDIFNAPPPTEPLQTQTPPPPIITTTTTSSNISSQSVDNFFNSTSPMSSTVQNNDNNNNQFNLPPSNIPSLTSTTPSNISSTSSAENTPRTVPKVVIKPKIVVSTTNKTQQNSIPDSLFRSSDPFSSPSIFGVEPIANDPFSAPPPSSHNAAPKTNKAIDIFDRPAPERPIDPFAPPVAPGRQYTQTTTPAPVSKVSAPISSKGTKSIPQKTNLINNTIPPTDHIPTPHGYVPVSSPAITTQNIDERKNMNNFNNNNNNNNNNINNNTNITNNMKQKKTTAAHFQHQVPLPSVVLPGEKGHTIPDAPVSSNPIISSYHRARGPYKPASGPIANFGFGGKLILMFPSTHSSVVTNPFYTPPPNVQERPTPPGKIKIYRVVDLAKAELDRAGLLENKSENITHPNYIRLQEIKHIVKLATSFPGPLVTMNTNGESKLAKVDDVKNFIQQRINDLLSVSLNNIGVKYGTPTTEKLLLELLNILIDTEGSLITDPTSHQSAIDPSSPENRISRLLLSGSTDQISSHPTDLTPFTDINSVQNYKNHLSVRNPNNNNNQNNNITTSGIQSEEEQWKLSQQYTTIETLLMLGRREEAVNIAIQENNWPLAILIASVCEKKTYQEVVKAYSDSSFPRSSGLNLLSLIYSNQAENTIRHGGKLLASNSLIDNNWSKNLTAVISNKVDDWSQLARHIGDRVIQETGDVMAAHFAYVVSGALFGRSKISLIGALDEIITKPNDKNPPPGLLNQSIPAQSGQAMSPQYAKKYMTDVRNMLALKMTEIYEWSLEKGLERLNGSGNQSSSSSTLVNMLGLSKNSESEKNQLSNLQLIRPSNESVLKSKIYLCSYKFRYALVLSDLGLVSEALEYAIDVKNFIHFINTKMEPIDSKNSKSKLPPSSKPPLNNNNNNSNNSNECSTPIKPQPFSRGFINTVHEFIDRLSGGNSSKNNNNNNQNGNQNNGNNSNSSSSTWNVWNMFNSANLKDLVDGSNPGPQPQQSSQPSQSQNKLAPPPISSNSPSTLSKPPLQNKDLSLQPPPTTMSSNSIPPLTNNSNNNGPPTMPLYSMNQIPTQNLAPPPTIPGISLPPTTTSTSQHSNYPPSLKNSSSTGDLRDIPINDNISYDPTSLQNRSHSHSNPPSNNGIASQPNHKRQHSLDISSSSSSSIATTSSPSSTSLEKTSPSKVAAISSSKKESENTIVASVRKGLLGWLYPEAHDTSQNMGGGLEATYDKATGKWIFPDDPNNPSQPNPADAPPPIMVPPIAPIQSTTSTTDNDPLAALMAPPARTYGAPPQSSSSSTTDSDPLASLMAPPPVRIPSQTTIASGPPGGPPVRRVAAAPSTKVWTPPVNIMKPNPVSSTLSDPFSQFSTPSIEPSFNGNEQQQQPQQQQSQLPPPPLQFQSNEINNPEYFPQNDQLNNSQYPDGVNSSLPPPPLQFNQYSQIGQSYQSGNNGGMNNSENNNNYSLPPPPL